MVKMFGWESRMDAKISEKREEELKWTRSLLIFSLLSDTIKWVSICPVRWVRLIIDSSFIVPIVTMIATYST